MTRVRGARRRPPIRQEEDPAKIGPLLREAGFIGVEADPVRCVATYDGAGRPISVLAHYQDGWRCRMRLNKDGSYSLSQSVSVTIRSKPKGEA